MVQEIWGWGVWVPKCMFLCSNSLADPNSGGYPSFGSLSLTAVLFGSCPEESDQCSSEAVHGAHTHAGVYRNMPLQELKTMAIN